jgi:YD repeat-containing protein
MDVEYRYSTTQNNGQITQMKNWISGEEVNYSYDGLGRLSAASTTGPEWGLSFGYDGFGNKVSQTVTKGSGPSMSVAVDGNNRVVGHTYDAAGFTTAVAGQFSALTWDSAGRLLSAAVAQNTGVASLSYYFRNVSKTGPHQDIIRTTQAGIEALGPGGHDQECSSWFEDALRRQNVTLEIFFASIAPQMGHGELGQSATGRPDPALGAVTGGNLPLGLAVVFNTFGGFFRDTGKPVSVGDVFQQALTQINPNSDQARVLIMLHEWAHVVGALRFSQRWSVVVPAAKLKHIRR